MSMAAAGKCRLVPPSVKGWASNARLAIAIRGDGVAATLARCRLAGHAGGVCVVLGRFVGCTTAWARGRAEDGTNLMALDGRRHAGGVARGRREGAERDRAF